MGTIAWSEPNSNGLMMPRGMTDLPSNFPSSVNQVLSLGLQLCPDADAVVGPHSRLTYRLLDEAAARVASAFRSLGVKPGDRVGASLENGPETVAAFLGALRAGAIWVGINRGLAPAEKAMIIEDADVCLWLADEKSARELQDHRAGGAHGLKIVSTSPSDPTDEWKALLETSTPLESSVRSSPESPAAMAYTSGTTGRPKGVVHSHRNLLLPGAVRALWGRRGDDRVGVSLPLTILNLMILGPLAAFQRATTCVVMNRVDAKGIAEWVHSESVTSLAIVPTTVFDLVSDLTITPEDLASLLDPVVGGASVPAGLGKRFEEKFGSRLTRSYGLTEAPTAVAMTADDSSNDEGSSGRPLDHVVISVCSPEGDELAPLEVGEICIGPRADGPWAGMYSPMLGYWRRPEETRSAHRYGLLWTGDLGYLTDGGQLYVTARKSDVIVRGGAKVYPAEIERVLNACPGVAGSLVLGLPDERLGERIVAAVEFGDRVAPSHEQLREACRLSLARFKVPEEFLVLSCLPRNAMGKVNKRDVLGLLEDEIRSRTYG